MTRIETTGTRHWRRESLREHMVDDLRRVVGSTPKHDSGGRGGSFPTA